MSPLLGANFARQGDGEKTIKNLGNGKRIGLHVSS